MPTETNLNRYPYFVDFDPKKQYYRNIYKPSVSVQTRELNIERDYTQYQIESFADNIFKKGTIVQGCTFNFYNNYQYVKLVDTDLDGFGVLPENYVSKFVKNANNLTAFVMNSVDGFEAQDPDLNTIYVRYTSSGDTGTAVAFGAGDILTVYDSDNGIFGANVVAGGIGFSNTDVLVYSPAVAVKLDTGAFSNGDYICQTSTGANLEIIQADTDTLASQGKVLLYVKPRSADLANASVNAVSWTLEQLETVTNATNTVSGIITDVYGTDFNGSIITNGVGKVMQVVISQTGKNFIFDPYLSVKSANNLTGINALNLKAKSYFAKVKVASVTGAVGTGYAFSVAPGIVYQKGYMLDVQPQTVIVSKYDNSPNNVVVGFNTIETIVDSNIDDTLLDNALGTKNETAPGADRLKLTPTLVVMSANDATSNTDFNPLVKWSEGQPYQQNQLTQYERIGDEMAQRTFDESGNFVIDTFQITTMTNANNALVANKYTVAVDPGQAYINGYKVQTLRNYYIDVDKGIDTKIVNNVISINYGNYIRVKELGGLFQFSTAATVDFYDTPKQFLSNSSLVNSGNVNPIGTKIGTARMRSLTSESGVPGDPLATYRLYVFDIAMNPGRNFADVRSVVYGGTNPGIADVVLTPDPSTNKNIAKTNEPQDGLIFSAGVESLKNSNQSTYIYRTIDQTTAFGNNGVLTKSIAANPNEFFPYNGNLTSSQMNDLLVIPIANTLTQYTDLVGFVSVNATSNIVTGNGTTFFSDFVAGDYIKATANASSSEFKKVVKVINNTSLQVTSAFGFANDSCTFKRVFPKNIPIPFGQRQGLSANVNSNGNVLNLTLAHSNGLVITVDSATSVNTAIVTNVQRTNVTSTSKTANRNKFVKIFCGNNAGGINGPWSLGVPDVFRLRNVYVGNSSVDTSSPNLKHYFYIDTNQTKNYLDLSWLYVNPRTSLSLTDSDYILVEFDYFTRAGDGYFDTVSYVGTSNSEQLYNLDSQSLANLGSSASSLEVPEVYASTGDYYDLLNQIDFRPAVSNTVTPGSNSSTAPLNPSANVSFGNTASPLNDKKFPFPDSAMTTQIEQYMGRVDSVYITGDTGSIYVLKGIADVDPRKRYEANQPKASLKLQTLTIPPYPNITDNLSANVTEIIQTGTANERSSGIRLKAKVITPILSNEEFQLSQPMVYTMEDIANLERRIADLEYYTGLSILETSITNKVIPSSVDGTLNRFKFGFFADDFSTIKFSDLENPQYAAAFETEGTTPWGVSKSPLDQNNWANSDSVSADSALLSPTKLVQKATNRVTPPKLIWTLPHNVKNLAYIDEPIIQQTYCSNTPAIAECQPKPANSVATSTVSNGYFYISVDQNLNSSVVSYPVQFGSKSGNVTVFFNNYDGNYSKYEIYKGTTLVASSSAAANSVLPLTTSDIAFLTLSSTNGSINGQGSFSAGGLETYARNGDNVNEAGKIQFTHDPSTGVNYVIKVTRKNPISKFEFLVQFPLSAAQHASVIVDPCKLNPGTIVYQGTIKFSGIDPGTYWSCSKQFAINHVRVTAIGIVCTGLKPNTVHSFFVDSQDQTAYCALIPPNLTLSTTAGNRGAGDGDWIAVFNNYVSQVGQNPLLSDPSGKLAFLFEAPYNQDNWFQAVLKNSQQATWGSSGYSTFMVQAPNSIATKLVARRTDASTIPLNVRGNP